MNFEPYLYNFKNVVDKEVEGWFYPKDIIIVYGILNEIQQITGDICEIGVAYGKSAIMISQFKGNSKFYLYDIFSEKDRIIAENNIKKFGNASNLEWRLEDTTKIKLDELKFDTELRFLHIDGCHEHSAVLNDLLLFSSKMSDKGIIAVDDFQDQEYPGVNSAVFQFCLSDENKEKWIVFAIGDNKAYMCKQKHQEIYQTRLVDYVVKSQNNYNVPFKMIMGLREILYNNAILCDSRNEWHPEVIKQKLFNKPEIR